MSEQTSYDREVAQQTMAWLFTDALLQTLADEAQSWVWKVPRGKVTGLKCRLGFRRAPFSEHSNSNQVRHAGLVITVEVPRYEGGGQDDQAEECHRRIRELLLSASTRFTAVSAINANMEYSVLTRPFWLGRRKTPVPVDYDDAHGTYRSEMIYLYQVIPK